MNKAHLFSRFNMMSILKKPLLIAALLLSGVSAWAQEVLPFSMEITHSHSEYGWVEIKITNDSRHPIHKIEGLIGDINRYWNTVGTFAEIISKGSGTWTFESKKTSNRFVLNGSAGGLQPGDVLRFHVDILGLTGIDYRRILFNNGTQPNAVFTVTSFASDGSAVAKEALTLPDGASDEARYYFASDSRPRLLSVDSIAEVTDASPVYVNRCTVKVNGLVVTDVNGHSTAQIGSLAKIKVYEGDTVEVSVPQKVYYDAGGNYLTDSSKSEAQNIRDNAMERFVGIGISVDDIPQSGDPTLYRFTVKGDNQISVKWQQQFALRMEHDFSNTKSLLTDGAGNPWAGPLNSQAVGNPVPEVKLHWIPKGETVIAQIDGQVQDYSHPGLNIRYVPVSYTPQGSAGTSDVAFTVGQSPPARQQAREFAMTKSAKIVYHWQIQYGIMVNADSTAHGVLPIIREDTGAGYNTVSTGEGIFWFNPGANLQVLCAENETTPTSLALSGWISGDGYYFSAQGQVNSVSGALLPGSEAGEHATWLPHVDASDGNGGTKGYRGLQISGVGLQRPGRVLWSYGNQAIAVTVPIGEYVLQQPKQVGGYTYTGSTFLTEPTLIKKVAVTGRNQNVVETDLTVWDAVAAKLYPVVPGVYRVTWPSPTNPDRNIDVLVTAVYPDKEHYPHIAGAPAVNVDPDPGDNFIFKSVKYTENEATVDGNHLFRASEAGSSVLLFSEIYNSARGGLKEYLRVRVVKTRTWDDAQVLQTNRTVTIGRRIEDALDLAGIHTGYLLFPGARYNPYIYDASKLEGLAAPQIYDMEALASSAQRKVIAHKENLPGPIIPVNLYPGASREEKIVVAWYDDPTLNDGILWPYATRIYDPRWPTDQAEGLGQIVIASQLGSESLYNDGKDQVVVAALTNQVPDGAGGFIDRIAPAETTYNPTRIQQPVIYNQPDPLQAGYNPNEEHALMAPSLRFAQVSPRPPAVYALRDNDLNRYKMGYPGESGQPVNYTSHPYVLTQFYDAEASEFKMRVYTVKKELPLLGYTFANAALWDGVQPSVTGLHSQPHVSMKAGEPVIPFYPLGVVIGAVSPPEADGKNITGQLTYWEDHKNTSWSVSGGENAWFTMLPFYPMSPDFWWDPDVVGRIQSSSGSAKVAAVPNVGDSIAFLPLDTKGFASLNPGNLVDSAHEKDLVPTQILYHSDWPDVAPVLKAGETLTFSGGEYRADHPTTQTLDANGKLKTVETPGLPEVLAFASAEVVFDSLNPYGNDQGWVTNWTARVGQVLEKRVAVLPSTDFPAALSPASGRVRISEGKYVFSELPASLQKRIRYDSTNGKLEFYGLINDKDIGDNTLTAPPPAVYVLEPNILTAADVQALYKLDESVAWRSAVDRLYSASQNPQAIEQMPESYLVGLEQKIVRDAVTGEPVYWDENAVPKVIKRTATAAAPLRALGPGLAVLPNAAFLDPQADVPDVSWITVVENNDSSLGGSPVTPHIIKVDRRERYRGAIKTVLSDNVFDENVVLRHQGDFGAHADQLVFEWWYRPDDGSLNVPPPDLIPAGQTNPWKLFPDLSGKQGRGRYEVMLKGDPNAPEALLADTWWFCRYRHVNDAVDGVDWGAGADRVNYTWAGAGNSDPFNDFDLNGLPDFQAQLAMGWIKRVLDAVNPYEARIRDFEGDSPSTKASIIAELGPRFEGPVALNPDKNVIENVGLIALYKTILKRGRDLSIDLSRPVATPAIANALELAATRISDFYMLLGNEAYADAQDPTIGFGSDSVEYGHQAPAVFTFQNQLASPIEEEEGLLRGLDDNFAKPVYNRLFWNFTKGEGEAAYALNYNITDVNMDGFIDEDDAMQLYPQGHGDAWGHYLTAIRSQYDLLRHPNFNWVSRSEFYNLMDVVLKVDFLDERKFAQIAAAKAKAGAEIVNLTYRDKYVEDPEAQWQGYTDSNPDRAWGVQGWARRAGQGAYFDWVTANALLPSKHPNKTLEGIQKVDRQSNADIAVVSANLNAIQNTFDQANLGYNPLGLNRDAVVFDIDPTFMSNASVVQGKMHFEQLYDRAVAALDNAAHIWDYANASGNRVRKVSNTEAEFRNDVFQEDLSYRNRLIEIFGRPYEGTIGSGKLYPAGYDGPDLALHMYIGVREINTSTVPGPSTTFAAYKNGTLSSGDLYDAFNTNDKGKRVLDLSGDWRDLFSPTFSEGGKSGIEANASSSLFDVNYTDLQSPKVPLANLADLMPVTTAGYSFQAPDAWGNRLATGQLQALLQQMLQQEAAVAKAIGAWDALQGELIRTLHIIDARIYTGGKIRDRNVAMARAKWISTAVINGINLAYESLNSGKELATVTADGIKGAIPLNLPTGGLAVSPGDALGPARGALKLGELTFKTVFNFGQIALNVTKYAQETAIMIAEAETALANGKDQGDLNKKEWLKELEDLVGDEPVLRIAVFKEIEALRELSDRYRTLLDEGARLVDERSAFNKRVAAATQLNRYQDMTFRVSRNHALRNYRASFDLAARYAYLAGKAYDYETSFAPGYPGAPQTALANMVKARSIGLVDGGVPYAGAGGLAEQLVWLKTNYDSLKGQLGINNPQSELGKVSLRTEKYRIYPKASSASADASWKQLLQSKRVENLWEVPEFREYCRPFDAQPSDGVEPGLVFRFSTDIRAGKNLFGLDLSGGDHSFDPTLYATKVHALGVWFSDYQSQSLSSDLAAAPRVYLIPVGTDIQSVSTAADPNEVRYWNVFDQRIPIPIPAVQSELDLSDWSPVFDTLSGRFGEQRRFSSFRAYHDGGTAVNSNELVFNSRAVGRSVRNTEWVLIIPGRMLNADPKVGLDRFIDRVSDIKLMFDTYGYSGN